MTICLIGKPLLQRVDVRSNQLLVCQGVLCILLLAVGCHNTLPPGSTFSWYIFLLLLIDDLPWATTGNAPKRTTYPISQEFVVSSDQTIYNFHTPVILIHCHMRWLWMLMRHQTWALCSTSVWQRYGSTVAAPPVSCDRSQRVHLTGPLPVWAGPNSEPSTATRWSQWMQPAMNPDQPGWWFMVGPFVLDKGLIMIWYWLIDGCLVVTGSLVKSCLIDRQWWLAQQQIMIDGG